MNTEQDTLKFEKDHPHPDLVGIESLFKFYKFDEHNLEYIKNLFIDGKLYHSAPGQFNDPFECKPHYRLPNNASRLRDLKKHLIKAAMNEGYTKKAAQALVLNKMRDKILYRALSPKQYKVHLVELE